MPCLPNCLRALVAVAILAAGCATEPSTPSKLHFKGVGFIEDEAPLKFGLRLENTGDAVIKISGVRTLIGEKLLMTTALNAVDDFEHRTFLLGNDLAPDGSYAVLQDGQFLVVQPGEVVELKGVLQWRLPDDAPPTVAVVRGTFTVLDEGDEELAECEPIMFVVQSRTGALDAVRDGPDAVLKQAAGPLYMISLGEGRKSPGARQLIREFQQAGLIR
jgi:hypothetical protein